MKLTKKDGIYHVSFKTAAGQRRIISTKQSDREQAMAVEKGSVPYMQYYLSGFVWGLDLICGTYTFSFLNSRGQGWLLVCYIITSINFRAEDPQCKLELNRVRPGHASEPTRFTVPMHSKIRRRAFDETKVLVMISNDLRGLTPHP